METVQGTAVIPLNDALECIGAILKLHLGSQTDESSLRGQNYLPGRPLYRERNQKLLQPDLQLALITHRLQAMSARLLPRLVAIRDRVVLLVSKCPRPRSHSQVLLAERPQRQRQQSLFVPH